MTELFLAAAGDVLMAALAALAVAALRKLLQALTGPGAAVAQARQSV